MLLKAPPFGTVPIYPPVELPQGIQRVSVISDASGTQKKMAVVDQRITLDVPALNALMIEF